MSREDVPEWAQAIANSLMAAVREKDPYTYGHCCRVARLSRLLAKSAGLDEYQQRIVEYSSLFHDLGKMGIPDSILLKPGKLTPEEDAIMRAHPQKSALIVNPLSKVPFFRSTLPGIIHHHERIDGKGYPHGVKGENIPLIARIILIADTVDAMTTSRPYRKRLPMEVAYKELELFSNRQFDPHLVKIFVEAHPTWGDHDQEITEEFIVTNYGQRKKAA